MSTFAIGDVQGCLQPLQRLLDALGYDRARDRLWFAGDLVNRGPESLATLRWVRKLGDSASTVLGNHDLHLLAIYYGGHLPNASDTLDDVLGADDAPELMAWLRTQPMLVECPTRRCVMTHAGIPHIWTLDMARRCAAEVEHVLRGSEYVHFFRGMYGNRPSLWLDSLTGLDRLKAITNYLTRMRLTDAAGTLDFSHKGAPVDTPEGYSPWYSYPARHDIRVLFGHWAALDGDTGVADAVALDTGCVWGRTLTAYCLETGKKTSVSADP